MRARAFPFAPRSGEKVPKADEGRVATVIILALFLALPLAAAERWWESYQRGVRAIQARDWATAAEALPRAIAIMPNENAAARIRNTSFPYLPHYYLGIAKAQLGDVDGALREWRISEDQGAIQNTEQWSRLRELVSRAQAQKAQSARGAAAESRKSADQAVSRALGAQLQAVAAGADRSDTYRNANRRLQEAVDQSKAANYARAIELASQARELFASATEEAKRLKANRPAAVAPRKTQPPPAPVPVPVPVPPPMPQPLIVPEPVQPPPPTPQPQPPVVEVESEALVDARVAVQTYRARLIAAQSSRRDDTDLQQQLRRAARDINELDAQLRRTPDPATIARVRARVTIMEGDLDAMLSRASSVVTATAQADDARAQLETAYRAFAAGDLDTADVLLTQLVGARPSGEAYLLRGCTRYTRAMLSRSPDALLASARGDFQSALKLKRTLRLPTASFSPKLIEFFESVRKAS